MSEDAPVNVGASGWPSDARAYLGVRRMQTKLHGWAATDGGRRFDDLWNLVCDPAFLTMAWERVAGNKGSKTPGVDRVTVARISSGVGVEEFLRNIRAQLRAGEFRPVPVRQVMIPKASGKLRKLGIPTVTDRVVQAALKLVLEPIFEADFKSCSRVIAIQTRPVALCLGGGPLDLFARDRDVAQMLGGFPGQRLQVQATVPELDPGRRRETDRAGTLGDTRHASGVGGDDRGHARASRSGQRAQVGPPGQDRNRGRPRPGERRPHIGKRPPRQRDQSPPRPIPVDDQLPAAHDRAAQRQLRRQGRVQG
nr:hypothetical protein [Brooklawnia sp. SH051]